MRKSGKSHKLRKAGRESGSAAIELRPRIINPSLWFPHRPPKQDWNKLRERVLTRDNDTCRFCGHRALSGQIVTEAAPLPILRLRDQPALYGIAVNVTKFLHELAFAPHVEIVVPLQPERLFG